MERHNIIELASESFIAFCNAAEWIMGRHEVKSIIFAKEIKYWRRKNVLLSTEMSELENSGIIW